MRPFQRILHPIDLDHLSVAAFSHALKIALSAASLENPALLELFHCETEQPSSFAQFPHVRGRLIRWGILPDGAEKIDVVNLGLNVRKQISQGEVGEEIALETETREFELLVMSSLARAGWSYSLHPSISASAVQTTQIPGLLFPREVTGFVNANTGQVDLTKILVPVAADPEAWPALQTVTRLLHTLRPCQPGEIMLVHVGLEKDFPEQNLPTLPEGWVWNRRTLSGEPVSALSNFAKSWEPQLASLASAGQKSWRDRWFGSTAEHLLNEFQCPVLVAPGEQV